MELKRNMGITLIALIITIIVMLILAGVSLNAIVGDNGILSNATKAASASKYASYLEDLQMSLVISGETPTVVGSDMAEYIESMLESDYENFIIIKGILYYIGSNNAEAEAAELVGISTDLSGGSAKEVMTIIESVIVIDDEDEYIGTKLLDKNQTNGTSWNLAIDYNSSNTEIARYGTGYYLLEPDIEYTINGETVTFSDYYVIDYSTQSLISSNNLKNWNFNSTVAVTKGLVLNIDPTNLENIDYVETTVTDDSVAGEGVETTAYQLYEDGTDIGITVYGDVVYDSDTSALVFNESDDNPLITEDGDTAGGGYMKLVSDSNSNEIDFSNGFTFEIYFNLSRGVYVNGISKSKILALFCRIPSLFYTPVSESMRFGVLEDGSNDTFWSCKFYTESSWEGEGSVLSTSSYLGAVWLPDENLFDVNSKEYFSVVYRVYSENTADDYQKEYYKENSVEIDKVEYYLNGNLYGYTYYGHDSYETGLGTWNDNCPFFLGVVPSGSPTTYSYLKGTVYATRLYTYSFTEDEVLENYNATVQYRNSFAN